MGYVIALVLFGLQPFALSAFLTARYDGDVRFFASVMITYALVLFFVLRYLPRVAYFFGVVVALLWAAGCGVSAYHDRSFDHSIPVVILCTLVGGMVGSYVNFLHPLELLFIAERTLSRTLSRIARSIARMLRRTPTESREGRSHHADERPPLDDEALDNPLDDPWSVLGVRRDASPEEIKRVYREQVRQYHPDKVHHLGIELQELAAKKVKALSDAYARLGRGHS